MIVVAKLPMMIMLQRLLYLFHDVVALHLMLNVDVNLLKLLVEFEVKLLLLWCFYGCGSSMMALATIEFAVMKVKFFILYSLLCFIKVL